MEQLGLSSKADSLTRTVSAKDLGDLFEYKLKEPITIRKNRSALVPIVQSPIDAEKVSIWNDQSGMKRPHRALWLTNSSGLTLDGGTFSVLEEETFAGEGVFDAIRPSEKRLVSYATDLAVNASSKNSTEQQRVTRVRIRGGSMIQESEIRESKTYTFRNEDGKPRTMIVEHPVRNGYRLRTELEPAESTASWNRFRFPVPPKQTASLVIEETRPLEATYSLSKMSPDQVALFVREKSIDKTVEAALQRILAQKGVIADLEKKKEEREGEMNKIFEDQQRLRENVKALKGSAEERALLTRYTQQLNAQESRLDVLRKESEKLGGEVDAAEGALDEMIDQLSLDVNLSAGSN